MFLQCVRVSYPCILLVVSASWRSAHATCFPPPPTHSLVPIVPSIAMASQNLDLHALCLKGRWQVVDEYVARTDSQALLAELGLQKGPLGYTPLHLAALSGSVSVLKVLLPKVADVDCRSRSGYTPLLVAASRGYDDCVKLLLESRADIGATDDIGRTPLLAAELCRMESTAQLLRNEGA